MSEIEEQILRLLCKQCKRMYPNLIALRLGRNDMPAIYFALRRMEAKGWVKCRKPEKGKRRLAGKRPRTTYSAILAGRMALQAIEEASHEIL